MKKQNYLIPRFPGGKRDHKKYRIWDGARYDAVIEPFAGGSAFSQQMILRGCKNVFLGECDPFLLPIYKCWLDPATHVEVYRLILDWQRRVRDALYDSDRIDVVWKAIKRRLDERKDYDKTEICAASLCLRKLTFGGVVRLNKEGKLNVKWCHDQISLFLRWRYRFPFVAEDCVISLSNDWQSCVSKFGEWTLENPEGRAISLVDPPYYGELPSQEAMDKRKRKDGITPVYPGHEPHSKQTLKLSIDPVRNLASMFQVKRLVVTNYYSDVLDVNLKAIAPDLRYRAAGKLDGLNMSRASGTEYVEGVWEIGEEYAKQTNLLELEPCMV